MSLFARQFTNLTLMMWPVEEVTEEEGIRLHLLRVIRRSLYTNGNYKSGTLYGKFIKVVSSQMESPSMEYPLYNE